MMEQFSFERLEAYKESIKLVGIVYALVEKFPKHELFSLSNQLHRAITSVPSNIAEGCGRMSFKEKAHHVEISYGSLLESYCQLQIAVSLHYITEEDFKSIKPHFFSVGRLLNGLWKGYQNKIPQKK